jgi:hypothetical protein
MFKKIIEWLNPSPFTDNEEDFVLKNEGFWYSNKYRKILYSGNKGKTFGTIHECREPLFTYGDSVLEYDYTFEPVYFDAETTSFSRYIDKFNSIKTIKEFEENEHKNI